MTVNRITDAERGTILELLDDGSVSYSEAARRTGLSYGRVYSIARQGGIIAKRHQEIWDRQAEQERREAADRERFPGLLEAYQRGDLTRGARIDVQVYDALCVQPAIQALDRDPLGGESNALEHLDSLVTLRRFSDG